MHCFFSFHPAKIVFGEEPAVHAVSTYELETPKFTKVQEVQKDKLQGKMDVLIQWWLRTFTEYPNPSWLWSTGSIVMRHDFLLSSAGLHFLSHGDSQ